MKFSVEKIVLQKALQMLIKISPARTTLPILNSVLFNASNARLEIRGTDLEVSMKIKISSKIIKEGCLIIPIKKLNDITNEMPDGKIEIEQKENNKIEITSEFGNYLLTGTTIDEFPSWTKIEEYKEISIDSNILKKLITKTAYAVSKDEIKPALQGVLFNIEGESLRVVSTDGAKLVKMVYKNNINKTFEGNVIIPTKFLSILKNHLENQNIKFLISKNHVMVMDENIEISTRIINQKYPDYESVIPTDNDKIVTIEKEPFLASIRRVSIFSNRSTNQISLNFANNKVTVFTQDPEKVSAGKETINCDYFGEELTIGFNAEYLKETISHQEEGVIKISMKTPISATVFNREPNENLIDMISLLMPIRTGE